MKKRSLQIINDIININSTTQWTVREYAEQLYTKRLHKLEEMEKILQPYNLPRLKVWNQSKSEYANY